MTKSTIQKAAQSAGLNEYDFVPEIITDICDQIEGYSDPEDFFSDLSYGGCQSGMIGIFIYNSDCKKFYVDHIDSMEDFKSDFEEELGEPITNRYRLPHYTFLCWLCYEETAHRIASELWPDKF